MAEPADVGEHLADELVDEAAASASRPRSIPSSRSPTHARRFGKYQLRTKVKAVDSPANGADNGEGGHRCLARGVRLAETAVGGQVVPESTANYPTTGPHNPYARAAAGRRPWPAPGRRGSPAPARTHARTGGSSTAAGCRSWWRRRPRGGPECTRFDFAVPGTGVEYFSASWRFAMPAGELFSTCGRYLSTGAPEPRRRIPSSRH